MYAGAFPVLPDRVVYPERIPDALHDRCLYADADERVVKLRSALLRTGASGEEDGGGTPSALYGSVARYDWGHVAPRYDAVLERLAEPA
jgi:hypothetical protein